MNKRMISTLATVCLLAACGGSGSPTTGTGSTTTSGSGGAGGGGTTTSATGTSSATTSAAGTGGDAPIQPLDEGQYSGDFSSVTDDTCSGFVTGGGVSPVMLKWSSLTNFTLQSQNDLVHCTLSQSPGSCQAYEDMIPLPSGDVLTYKSSGGPVKVVSSMEFIYTETIDVDCAGNGCAAYAMQMGTSFPCSVAAAEDYTM